MTRPNFETLHVCQLTPALAGGGTEERLGRISRGLDKRYFELSWLGFGPIEHELTSRIRDDVRVQSIERDPSAGIEARVVLQLASVLSKLRPDVVHVHNWSTSLYGILAARLAGVPFVFYGDGGRDQPDPPSLKRRLLMRALAPLVDRFTAVCQMLSEELVANWSVPKARVQVIRNGIDIQKIDASASREQARARLNIPADAQVVGMTAGRFRQVKQVPMLIRAVGALAKRHPSLHLLLIGDALGQEREIKNIAEQNGLSDRIHLTGHLRDSSAVLRAFDVVVNCSRFEGASNAILEAMASARPVIGTAVGGTPEMIADGDTGLLVGPADEAGLTAAIDRLLTDRPLSMAMGERASAYTRRYHNQVSMTKAYASFYRNARPVACRSRAWASALLARL